MLSSFGIGTVGGDPIDRARSMARLDNWTMTHSQAIAPWLKTYVHGQTRDALLAGLGIGFAAALVLFVTFWIIYGFLLMATLGLFSLPHETYLMISGIVLLLLFVGNATADRRALETYSFTTGTRHGKPVTLIVPFVGIGSTVNPLAPDSIHSQIKVVATVACSGPRLAAAAMRSFARALRLSRIDIEACAEILKALAAVDGPVVFADLARVVPGGQDTAAVLTQVQHIEGVRFVTSEPAGLSLYSELRKEMQKLGGRSGAGKRKKRKSKAEAREDSEEDD